jgi:hypothetical protein
LERLGFILRKKYSPKQHGGEHNAGIAVPFVAAELKIFCAERPVFPILAVFVSVRAALGARSAPNIARGWLNLSGVVLSGGLRQGGEPNEYGDESKHEPLLPETKVDMVDVPSVVKCCGRCQLLVRGDDAIEAWPGKLKTNETSS